MILIGTGSEVALCVEVYDALRQEGIAARVVSMPSWELFEQQDQAYRDSVLPPDVTARVSVEAGSVIGWDRYVGMSGARIGMHTFGASAPIKDLMTKFGFTPEKVLAAAQATTRTGQGEDGMSPQEHTFGEKILAGHALRLRRADIRRVIEPLDPNQSRRVAGSLDGTNAAE